MNDECIDKKSKTSYRPNIIRNDCESLFNNLGFGEMTREKKDLLNIPHNDQHVPENVSHLTMKITPPHDNVLDLEPVKHIDSLSLKAHRAKNDTKYGNSFNDACSCSQDESSIIGNIKDKVDTFIRSLSNEIPNFSADTTDKNELIKIVEKTIVDSTNISAQNALNIATAIVDNEFNKCARTPSVDGFVSKSLMDKIHMAHDKNYMIKDANKRNIAVNNELRNIIAPHVESVKQNTTMKLPIGNEHFYVAIDSKQRTSQMQDLAKNVSTVLAANAIEHFGDDSAGKELDKNVYESFAALSYDLAAEDIMKRDDVIATRTSVDNSGVNKVVIVNVIMKPGDKNKIAEAIANKISNCLNGYNIHKIEVVGEDNNDHNNILIKATVPKDTDENVITDKINEALNGTQPEEQSQQGASWNWLLIAIAIGAAYYLYSKY